MYFLVFETEMVTPYILEPMKYFFNREGWRVYQEDTEPCETLNRDEGM
jgi:hypothetical protein